MRNSRPKGTVVYNNAGRVVLVSGGAGGIGRAICDAFAATGADVVCLDSNADSAAELPDGKEKFASAHDLRRAFGTRWGKIVPPGILKELMRHANIETTMNFYVNITAKDTMSEVRRHLRKHGDSNSPKKVNKEVNE